LARVLPGEIADAVPDDVPLLAGHVAAAVEKQAKYTGAAPASKAFLQFAEGEIGPVTAQLLKDHF